ncbi:MAG: D-tyrosyl-tRNA(Tyr) deacylase [Betaproteobacteria bacterium]|nr:D-tyrosyl-tRNA(Tyr) deacylase [Betaproteobacteria bacterium]
MAIALLQRVTDACVRVDDAVVGEIGHGLLVLFCAEPADETVDAERLVERLLGYRVFGDDTGRMNLSLRDVGGALLLVPQFTLAADTRKGTRPGFSKAAPPEIGRRIFEHALAHARASDVPVEAGVFGADMKVSLTNDGPVTFWLSAGRGH